MSVTVLSRLVETKKYLQGFNPSALAPAKAGVKPAEAHPSDSETDAGQRFCASTITPVDG